MFRRLFAAFSLLAIGMLLGAVIVLPGSHAGPHRDALWIGTLVLTVIGLSASAVLSYWLTSQMKRPIADLVEAVEELSAGSTQARVFLADGDELTRLGESFNRMSERLGRQIGELEQDRQQLRTILSGMVEGVIALDAEQRILFMNARAVELLELGDLSPVEKHLWEVVRHRHLLDAVAKALNSSQPYREEINWTGDTLRSLTVHAARLPGPPPRGAVVVLHDTTELRRLERLRQDFVANVSHELKTPLSVIKVCVETLQDGAAADPVHRDRFLDQIARQADRLHSLILDVLSLARIESGQELFDLKPVSLVALAVECIERHRPRAVARQQELLMQVEEEPVVWADEEAVDTILENLLDNAVKYTQEGGVIRVRLSTEGVIGRLEVIDTGIGIPGSDLPRIFERFYRVDRARSREMGGTGLGLSIVKHLAQALHGNVKATSEVNVGTTFSVSLPLADP
ncbi:MAG: sensor histidine kinase [Planctomycetia bacterium]|nr:sensor histidine kinase [Planctomycetia bacterium]